MSSGWFHCLGAPCKSRRDAAAQAPDEPERASGRSRRGELFFDEKWSEPVERSLNASFVEPVERLSQQRAEGEGDLDKLFIVTWNVQMLPGVLPGCAGSVRHLVARAEQIAERILELEPWPDVVVLQEVWHPYARSELRCRLLGRYQHIHAPGAGSLAGARPGGQSCKTGLLVLSRYHNLHLEHRFHKFQASQGVESWAFGKGVSATAIRLRKPTDVQGKVEGIGFRVRPRTRCFVLFNVHAQSDYWRCGAKTRARQMEEVRDFIRESIEDFGHLDVRRAILCGDLNVEAGTCECDAAMATLGNPRDLLCWNEREERVWAPTFPIGRWRYDPCDDSRCRYAPLTPTTRLDYVLDVTHTEAFVRGREVTMEENAFDPPTADAFSHARTLTTGVTQRGTDGTPLSDHAPVLAMIAFS